MLIRRQRLIIISSIGVPLLEHRGEGLVMEPISSTVPGCTAPYALGGPVVVSGPVAGDTPSNATCSYVFPDAPWYVWGDAANAQEFCANLDNTPGASSPAHSAFVSSRIQNRPFCSESIAAAR
jgi:hypothetical protein